MVVQLTGLVVWNTRRPVSSPQSQLTMFSQLLSAPFDCTHCTIHWVVMSTMYEDGINEELVDSKSYSPLYKGALEEMTLDLLASEVYLLVGGFPSLSLVGGFSCQQAGTMVRCTRRQSSRTIRPYNEPMDRSRLLWPPRPKSSQTLLQHH